ncbi:hypothetical protein C8R46DRAFT_1222345 [Mycena filopes]|nr:hypothetical protein C8R46DRAFT_1222345 [Mycena filopes]
MPVHSTTVATTTLHISHHVFASFSSPHLSSTPYTNTADIDLDLDIASSRPSYRATFNAHQLNVAIRTASPRSPTRRATMVQLVFNTGLAMNLLSPWSPAARGAVPQHIRGRRRIRIHLELCQNLLPLRGAAEFLGFFFAARLIASWKLWKFSFRCAALVTPTATKIFFAARPGVSELVPGKGHPEGPKIVKFSRDQGIKSQISTGVRGTHLLLINAVVYAVVYGVTASISSLFHDTYPWLSETKLGLCFLTVGGGMILGSLFCGKLLDWDYQRVRLSLAAQGLTPALVGEKKGLPDDSFPIEKARMRLMPVFLAMFVAICVAYGWCVEKRTSIAGPLILLIGVGLVVTAVMNSIQTLMLDLMPTHGSSITACNNLVRCSLGAGLVSAIQPLLDALGAGYAYVLLGGLVALVSPLVYVVVRIGPRCRARRIRMAEVEKERIRAKEETSSREATSNAKAPTA